MYGTQTADVTFEVTQGHWYWYHWTGHIWFSKRFSMYNSESWSRLIYQNLKRSHDPEHDPFGDDLSCMR